MDLASFEAGLLAVGARAEERPLLALIDGQDTLHVPAGDQPLPFSELEGQDQFRAVELFRAQVLQATPHDLARRLEGVPTLVDAVATERAERYFYLPASIYAGPRDYTANRAPDGLELSRTVVPVSAEQADGNEPLADRLLRMPAAAIVYIDASGAHSERVINPINRVLNRSGNEVLNAYCHLRGDERHFRLDRIVASSDADVSRYPRPAYLTGDQELAEPDHEEDLDDVIDEIMNWGTIDLIYDRDDVNTRNREPASPLYSRGTGIIFYLHRTNEVRLIPAGALVNHGGLDPMVVPDSAWEAAERMF